jgi:hypothetical protein
MTPYSYCTFTRSYRDSRKHRLQSAHSFQKRVARTTRSDPKCPTQISVSRIFNDASPGGDLPPQLAPSSHKTCALANQRLFFMPRKLPWRDGGASTAPAALKRITKSSTARPKVSVHSPEQIALPSRREKMHVYRKSLLIICISSNFKSRGASSVNIAIS